MAKLSPEQIKAMKEKYNVKPSERPMSAGTAVATESPMKTPVQAATAPKPALAAKPAPVVKAPAAAQKPAAPAPAPAIAKSLESKLDDLLAKDSGPAIEPEVKPNAPAPDSEIVQTLKSIWGEVKSKQNKLFIVGVSVLALYIGGKVATHFYELNVRTKTEQVRVLQEKKDKEELEAKKAKSTEELKAALKAKEEAKEKKITARSDDLAKRCDAAATQPAKERCDKSKWDSLLCRTEDKKGSLKRLAQLHEQGKDFRNAGLLYIEIADVEKTKAMIKECGNARPSCAKDLIEEADIMAKALARNIGKQ